MSDKIAYIIVWIAHYAYIVVATAVAAIVVCAFLYVLFMEVFG